MVPPFPTDRLFSEQVTSVASMHVAVCRQVQRPVEFNVDLHGSGDDVISYFKSRNILVDVASSRVIAKTDNPKVQNLNVNRPLPLVA